MNAPLRLWRSAAGLGSLLVALSGSGLAAAHHSFAMFDRDRQVTVDGVVHDFQWTNPHIWIQLMVEEDGKPVEYSVEAGSPNTLARRGWTSKSLKPGDRVKVTMNPLREESRKGGNFVKAVLPDGSTLTQG